MNQIDTNTSDFEIISESPTDSYEASEPVPRPKMQCKANPEYNREHRVVKFNQMQTCSLRCETENRTNRIDIMQADADQYTFYLRCLQESDEEERSFLILCNQRKFEVMNILSKSVSWLDLLQNIQTERI